MTRPKTENVVREGISISMTLFRNAMICFGNIEKPGWWGVFFPQGVLSRKNARGSVSGGQRTDAPYPLAEIHVLRGIRVVCAVGYHLADIRTPCPVLVRSFPGLKGRHVIAWGGARRARSPRLRATTHLQALLRASPLGARDLRPNRPRRRRAEPAAFARAREAWDSARHVA